MLLAVAACLFWLLLMLGLFSLLPCLFDLFLILSLFCLAEDFVNKDQCSIHRSEFIKIYLTLTYRYIYEKDGTRFFYGTKYVPDSVMIYDDIGFFTIHLTIWHYAVILDDYNQTQKNSRSTQAKVLYTGLLICYDKSQRNFELRLSPEVLCPRFQCNMKHSFLIQGSLRK